MRTLAFIFAICVALIFISTACNNETVNIQDKWWYDESETGNDIIKFTDHKVYNLNDNNTSTYDMMGDTLVIDSTRWTIVSAGSDELVIEHDTITRTFREAQKKDFVIGKWKSNKKNKKVKYRFLKNGELIVKEKGEESIQMTYGFNNTKIIIDNQPYKFEISEDKTELILKGKENLKLTRD